METRKGRPPATIGAGKPFEKEPDTMTDAVPMSTKRASEMSDGDLGVTVTRIVADKTLTIPQTGVAVRALFADDRPARDELAEVRSDITRTAAVVHALFLAVQDQGWPDGVPRFICIDCTDEVTKLHHLLARERDLLAKCGGNGNG